MAKPAKWQWWEIALAGTEQGSGCDAMAKAQVDGSGRLRIEVVTATAKFERVRTEALASLRSVLLGKAGSPFYRWYRNTPEVEDGVEEFFAMSDEEFDSLIAGARESSRSPADDMSLEDPEGGSLLDAAEEALSSCWRSARRGAFDESS